MFKQVSVAAIALSASLSMSSHAGPIPYPDIGTPAPTSEFFADTDGFLTVYFMKAWASVASEVGLVGAGGYGLSSASSVYGSSFLMGEVTAGQELTFELFIPSWNVSWFSDPDMNMDKKNHTYSTDFAGDAYIPAGTYVSFEDLPQLGDKDYNDYQFVYTITPKVREEVPEPLSLVLFGLGRAALGFARTRAV